MKYQLLKTWRRYLTNFRVATEVCPLLQIHCHQIWEYCAVWGKLRGLKWFYDMKRTIQNPNKAPSQQRDIWKSYEISWNRKSHVSLYLNSNQRSLKLCPNWGEEAEICVKGACVTKGYATWQWNVKVQSAECREVNLMNVYESATSIATKEMRAHMDQDPNIEAFTTDGWLRTGDKGCLLRAGRTFFEASSTHRSNTCNETTRRQTIRNSEKAALIGMAWWCMMSGYIDENNYLCLSGRYKEIINRGELKHVSTFVWTTRLKKCKKHIGKQPFG